MSESVVPATINIEDVVKLDLRVVTITEAKIHPNGDKLVVLQCNDGTDNPRQIVAGIRQHYSVEKLTGLQIVIIANLEPRMLRGELSQGMLLAAKDAENRLAVLSPQQVERPSSYYGGEAELWTCVFPGKMGISWKLAWNNYGTKAEAEEQAAKNRNVVAVPWALWLRYKEYEHRCVAAERKLMEVAHLRLDYNEGEIGFTDFAPKPDAVVEIGGAK